MDCFNPSINGVITLIETQVEAAKEAMKRMPESKRGKIKVSDVKISPRCLLDFLYSCFVSEFYWLVDLAIHAYYKTLFVLDYPMGSNLHVTYASNIPSNRINDVPNLSLITDKFTGICRKWSPGVQFYVQSTKRMALDVRCTQAMAFYKMRSITLKNTNPTTP